MRCQPSRGADLASTAAFYGILSEVRGIGLPAVKQQVEAGRLEVASGEGQVVKRCCRRGFKRMRGPALGQGAFILIASACRPAKMDTAQVVKRSIHDQALQHPADPGGPQETPARLPQRQEPPKRLRAHVLLLLDKGLLVDEVEAVTFAKEAEVAKAVSCLRRRGRGPAGWVTGADSRQPASNETVFYNAKGAIDAAGE
jgi:hypothetical protein